MVTSGASQQREAIAAVVEEMCPKLFTRGTPPEVYENAFSGWGGEENAAAWKTLYAEHARRTSSAADQETRAAFTTAFGELLGLASALELLDTGGLGARFPAGMDPVASAEQGGGDYDTVLAEEMSRAESAGWASSPLFAARERQGPPLLVHAHIAGVDPEPLAVALRLTEGQVDALPEVGSVVRVDRVDGLLVDVAVHHIEGLAREAGLEVRRGGISRAAAVNIACAAVISAAQVPGITLDTEGEVMVDVVSRAGDLRRSISVDANLAALGHEIDRLRKVVVGSRAASIRSEVNSMAAGMLASLVVGEQLRIPSMKLPLLSQVDQVPVDLGEDLYRRAVSSAELARRTELERTGRSTAGHPDRKKK